MDLLADEALGRGVLGCEPYETTLIHVQPQPFFEVAYVRGGLAERQPRTYRIGYWYWETDTAPSEWARQAALIDELWVATSFVADAVRDLGVPTFTMPPGLNPRAFKSRPRGYFGLPEQKFLFLFAFHLASSMERKNPLGLIAAYRLAFGADPSASLVIKVSSAGTCDPALLAALHREAADEDVIILDAVMTDEDMLALMEVCDCYVSLHRSEGFGLTMAEAMLLGKPVIATGYSGNLDFMSRSNSLLVDHRLVTLDRDMPPYAAGAHWAEPSIEHAGKLMRRVRDEPALAAQLGAKARDDIRRQLSTEATGERVARRLDEIARDARATAQPVATSG